MADAEFPHGRRYYTKSGYFKTLDDSSIDHMVEALGSIPSPMTQIELAYLGGAAARVGAAETAFGDRSSPFVVNVLGNWSDAAEDAANIAWVRNLFRLLRPAMTPGVYVSFMGGDEDDRVPEAFQQRWERLVAIKSHYDPDNLFRLNQNIRPQKRISWVVPKWDLLLSALQNCIGETDVVINTSVESRVTRFLPPLPCN